MKFIDVISESSQKDCGRKRKSSLGISEKRPHVLAITGGIEHGSDIFLDKSNTKYLIKFLQNELKTMKKYQCFDCGSYESNLSKCDKCKII